MTPCNMSGISSRARPPARLPCSRRWGWRCGQVFPGDQYMVTFEDVDGEENGGEFETLVLDITDKVEKVGVGSGSWHDGDYTAELGDVTMILKEK